jgi:hypothetical protein
LALALARHGDLDARERIGAGRRSHPGVGDDLDRRRLKLLARPGLRTKALATVTGSEADGDRLKHEGPIHAVTD